MQTQINSFSEYKAAIIACDSTYANGQLLTAVDLLCKIDLQLRVIYDYYIVFGNYSSYEIPDAMYQPICDWSDRVKLLCPFYDFKVLIDFCNEKGITKVANILAN